MRNLLAIATYLLFAFSVFGCAATGPLYSEVAVDVPEGKAELVIYRNSQLAAAGGCYRIMVDGEEIGILQNGGYIRKYVEPGSHSITAVIGDGVNLEITAREKERNFVLLKIGLSGMSAFPVGTVSVVNAAWNVALIDTPSEYGNNAVQTLRESQTTSTCMSK